MTRDDFERVFLAALKRGLNLQSPGEECSKYLIELHGLGSSGDVIDFESAATRLFGDGENFFFIIDVLVKRVSGDVALVFCRPSGHALRPWSETWDPSDLGPFRVLGEGGA